MSPVSKSNTLLSSSTLHSSYSILQYYEKQDHTTSTFAANMAMVLVREAYTYVIIMSPKK